jgi:hypothetical protein
MSNSQWLTPKEILEIVGVKKSLELLNDLITNTKPRAELLADVMTIAKCNDYSADDFLTDLVKNPPKE